MTKPQFTQFDAKDALEDIEALATRQCPGLLEQYQTLHVPTHKGRIAYLGAGHDFLLPHAINNSDKTRYRFKLVDDYGHGAEHDHQILSEFLEEGWKIVSADSAQKLEQLVERGCTDVVIYRKDRASYARTVGKSIIDAANYIITDQELVLPVIGQSVATHGPDIMVPRGYTPDGKKMTLPVSKVFYTYQKK